MTDQSNTQAANKLAWMDAATPQRAQEFATNEWADVATNGVQYLRNVKDGICTFEDAIDCMLRDITYCREVSSRARKVAASHPEPVALQGRDELDKLTLTITFDDDVDCGIEVFGTTQHLQRLKTWLERCDTANQAIDARASLPAGDLVARLDQEIDAIRTNLAITGEPQHDLPGRMERIANLVASLQVTPQPSEMSLSIGEQEGLLKSPPGLLALINLHHCWDAEASGIGYETTHHDDRIKELRALGKPIVEQDPDIWEDEILREFGVAKSTGPLDAGN